MFKQLVVVKKILNAKEKIVNHFSKLSKAFSFKTKGFFYIFELKYIFLFTFFTIKNLSISFIFLFSSYYSTFGLQKKNDSISIWIKTSKNNKLSFQQRKSYLDKAYKVIELEKESSYQAKILSQIAYRYFKATDTATFLKLNDRALKIALKVKDSFVIADTNWSLAEYYSDKG